MGCLLYSPTVPEYLSSSSLLHLERTLIGYVGRGDGDKGPALRDSPRQPLHDLINSKSRLGLTTDKSVNDTMLYLSLIHI